jgi:UDP-N-acetylmuramoyl-L-alanyl-D-glutamate--2,6-diaminopimelate ligase
MLVFATNKKIESLAKVARRPPMTASFPHQGSSRSRVIRLREFLPESVFVGAEDIEVRRCVNRADRCRPGDVFIPTSNSSTDEHDNADEAVRRGAIAIVAERILPVSVPQCLVENTQEVHGRVCQALAGNPSSRMLTIGVVGTYGKTTTGLFVAAMLKRMGGAVGYYTSLGASDSVTCDRTATRAPAAGKLAKWMEACDKAGAPAVIVELTPSMLNNHASAGVEFDLLIVTGMRPGQYRGSPNTRDFARLLERAARSLKPNGLALYNADDSTAASWAANTGIATCSYGLDAAEHVRAKRLSKHGGEQQLLCMAGHLLMPLTLKMPGDHIARAALAAVAASWLFEFSVPEAIAGIESLVTIPGRMQRLSQAVDVPLFIDAGETPDRVAVSLHALRQHQFGPATVVIDLNGCIAASHRQQLGELLDKCAERVVISASDLSVDAALRLAMDVLGGFRAPGRVQVIPDRVAAIRWAVEHTDQGCILLSGCGTASWIDRNGDETSDERVAKQAIEKRNVPTALPLLSIFPPPEQNPNFAL